ncbi:MAG: hypothetical protein A3E80_02485 [Chlamydiae bacterium RIFCSPHIGHO2_12_FULL_49_9]|nr:MAG: hypothetical protein A3E80_02485 [Chlamydiae bacterium RIFCSPHIGHO2_12_FULL_49_9]
MIPYPLLSIEGSKKPSSRGVYATKKILFSFSLSRLLISEHTNNSNQKLPARSCNFQNFSKEFPHVHICEFLSFFSNWELYLES